MKKILLLSSILLLIATGSFLKLRPKIEEKLETTETEKIISRPNPTASPNYILPSYYLIKTAFVPQAPEKNWSEPWQDACEEAALITVDYYYRHQTDVNLSDLLAEYQSLFDYETQLGFTHDVNLAQMATVALGVFNFTSQIIDNPSVDTLKQYLAQDIPVIVPANGKTLFKENTHFKNGGPWYHNLVILGYDDQTSQFIVHDVGTQFGAYYRYSYSLLMDSLHDFPENGLPSSIDSGPRRVLLLLK